MSLKSTKEKKDDKKIAFNNYIILSIVFVISLVLVIALRNWYVSYENYQLTIPILKGKLNEITVSEIDNYLTENTDAIVFIQSNEDEVSREVAKDLVDLVKERNLLDRIVYLNVSSDSKSFFQNFNKNYMESGKIDKYPALVLFDDGKVVAFVASNDKQDLNIGDIEQLFDEYELEES